MTRASGPWRPPARPEQSGAPAGSAEPTGPGSPTSATDPVGPPPEEIHTAWVLWLAAAAFGGVMAAVLSSDSVSGMLLGIIQKALAI